MISRWYRKMRSFFVIVIHCSPFIRKIAYAVRGSLKGWEYSFRYGFRYKIDDHIAVFEAYQGRQFACSPKALFKEMVSDSRYENLKKIWFFKVPEEHRDLLQYKNTKIVLYGSHEYFYYYARAKYWISNSNLPPYIKKKPGQIYIQTWHGTPFKKIGCDLEVNDNPNTTLHEVYKKYMLEGRRADYFLSPSPYYTRRIMSAFRIGDQKKILELGYPRNDTLYSCRMQTSEVRNRLGIPVDKKVILYAPTWRDNQFKPGIGAVYYDLHIDFEQLQEQLGDEYLILFRTHYFISNTFDFSRYVGFIKNVSSYDDINDLYLASDLLLTDYSSVFFDYANLKRPIVFYMYDYDEYKGKLRDFYFDEKILPGPVVKQREQLAESIKNVLLTPQYSDVYRRFNEKFNAHPVPCSKEVLERCIKI